MIGSIAAMLLSVAPCAAETSSTTATAPLHADVTLEDGSRQGLSVRIGEGVNALTAYQNPVSSATVATGAILIFVPEDAGDKGASVQLRLSPAAEPGKERSWDLTPQVQAAVKAGRFPAQLAAGNLMLQFLKGKRGEAVGAPLSAVWTPPGAGQ